jgi:hypothetical protein
MGHPIGVGGFSEDGMRGDCGLPGLKIEIIRLRSGQALGHPVILVGSKGGRKD